MIREVQGTVFITADAFRDRYRWCEPGMMFGYATGNMASACKVDQDARELQCVVYNMENKRKLKLSKEPRGPNRFEYFATRLAKEQANMGAMGIATSAPAIRALPSEQVQAPTHGRKKPKVPCE